MVRKKSKLKSAAKIKSFSALILKKVNKPGDGTRMYQQSQNNNGLGGLLL